MRNFRPQGGRKDTLDILEISVIIFFLDELLHINSLIMPEKVVVAGVCIGIVDFPLNSIFDVRYTIFDALKLSSCSIHRLD